MQKSLETAVLFLIFNRIDTTKQVFKAIRTAKPPKLYIGADGARKDQIGEIEKVKAVREYVMSSIDWDCEVKILFRDSNLGCKMSVSGAIDWFFENEEMGIILEDDCLPSQIFFWYCEELLAKYKDDERIFLISGYNKQNKWQTSGSSYFFSYFGGIWGWASWKRAWQFYDVEAKDFNKFIRENGFVKLMGDNLGKKREEYLKNMLGADTWDYQWAYTRHKNSGLSCVPKVSFIKNIGFGDNATHTSGENNDNVENNELSLPLIHPAFIIPDREYDFRFLKKDGFLIKMINKFKRVFK